MTTPKEQYDARQRLKRIARGDDPDAKTEDEIKVDMVFDLADRFVTALEKIADAMIAARSRK